MARKGSVLVVDDEEIMRDVLETLLSSEGYRVDLAKTGEEGLDAYTKRAYDAVLLDVSMPCFGRILKAGSGCRGLYDHCLCDIRHGDCGLGKRRFWLHSQAISKRT